MKTGDLVKYAGSTGLTLRQLQYDNDKDCEENWDGARAWWVLFMDNIEPYWAYEVELTLVKEGN